MAFTHARADVTASWFSATDVPVTTAGYTATGNSVDLSLNFAPDIGATLTIIKNTGLAFIEGTYSNLAQGQPVELAFGGRTYDFVANYYGGSGRDLVLQWAGMLPMAWGDNHYGQLGNNSRFYESRVPVAVVNTGVLAGKTVVSLAAGSNFSLALCSDGTAASWGTNQYGQLGNNSTDNGYKLEPVEVAMIGPLAGKRIIAIAAGLYQGRVLCSDGTLAVWGNDYSGEIYGPVRTHLAPTAVNTTGVLAGKTVVSIASGGTSLALCSDGTIVAYGSSPPVAVDNTGVLAGKIVTAIAAGGSHNLALCSDGRVVAWGSNNSGRLGNNSTTDSSVPVAVNTDGVLAGKTVTAIAAGQYHSLALCSDGTLAAWGWNGSGQLGDGSYTLSSVPVAVNRDGVLAGKTVVAIAAGYYHSQFLCSDGTLATCGYNLSGSYSPAKVPVAASLESLATGDRYATTHASSLAQHGFGLVAAISPRVSLTGNGVAIPSGGASPSLADGTDFGLTKLPGTQVTRTFSITNTGAAFLRFTGPQSVVLTGDGAPDFEVTVQPQATAPGDSTTLAITFDPTLPGRRTATVTIKTNDAGTPGYSFDISGTGAPLVKLAQAITFAPPATLYSGQSPFTLRATASSGLPVTLTLASGNATLAGYALTSAGAGIVKVSASVPANERYNAAPTIIRTITIKSDPTTLTLINLNQTYDGLPKPVATLGSEITPVITYKVGTAYVPTAPTTPGSYPVKAVAGIKTVTGTLVIAKAPLYLTPDDKHKYAGQANPAVTVSYSGFVNGETAAVLTKVPVLTTTATSTSGGGLYPITASGAAAANYTLIYHQGTLVVDSFAGNYEALLRDANQLPVGKLTLTVPATGKTFTAKLTTADPAAPAFTGSYLLVGQNLPSGGATGFNNVQALGSATTNVTLNKVVTPFTLNFTLLSFGRFIATVTRAAAPWGSASDGQKLSTKPVLFAGAHTAILEPATPAATNVPKGAGWATVSAGTTGVLTFAGKLGDGTAFTTTLNPDRLSDPGYRLFVQPYVTARAQSFLAGAFTFAPHPVLANRRYLAQQSMTWKKTGLAADATYRSGFGPVSTVLMIDPWLPPAAATKTTPAISLGLRLGSSLWDVTFTPTGSARDIRLPTRVLLSSTNTVTVRDPNTIPVSPTKWKIITLAPTTGTFTGSFELIDGTLTRLVSFSGVLRQPAISTENLIGDSHYLLPPLTGTEKTTGEMMFTRP